MSRAVKIGGVERAHGPRRVGRRRQAPRRRRQVRRIDVEEFNDGRALGVAQRAKQARIRPSGALPMPMQKTLTYRPQQTKTLGMN